MKDGLPNTIDYRVTDYDTTFRRSLARLPRDMAGLTAENRDDPTVALLDAFAMVADVLTFYQERIANEGYLRTATEERSILEMARQVGRELSTGLAASAELVFSVDGTAGPIAIPPGVQVLSVPRDGRAPVTFETSEHLEARAAWNALRVAPGGLEASERPADNGSSAIGDDAPPSAPTGARSLAEQWAGKHFSTLDATARELVFSGTNTGLSPGNPLLIVGDNWSETTLPDWSLLTVMTVSPDEAGGVTRVTWGGDLSTAPPRSRVYALRKSLPLFGHDAPAPVNIPRITQAFIDDTLAPAITSVSALRGRIRELYHQGGAPKALKTEELAAADAAWEKMQTIASAVANETAAAPGTWPDYKLTPGEVDLAKLVDNFVPAGWMVLIDHDRHRATPTEGAVVRWVEDVYPTRLDRFGLKARVSRAVVVPAAAPDLRLEGTTALIGSEYLELATASATDAIKASDDAPPHMDGGDTGLLGMDRVRTLDPVDGALTGRLVVFAGRRRGITNDKLQYEVAEILRLSPDQHLLLRHPLTIDFDPDGLLIHANVSSATHGETVVEVIGSGDSSRAGQRFALRRGPVTFLGGAVSTVRIEVGGVPWRQVSSLVDVGGTFPGFELRINETGTAEVRFGDGVHGSRLPTGMENVHATYRVGLGPTGMVAAAQLTVMVRGPMGVFSVTNPLPAVGGEPPDDLERGRLRVSLSTVTAGRLISRADFERFSLGFEGIGAVAVQVLGPFTHHSMVHVTAAAPDGAMPSKETLDALEQALTDDAAAPGRTFRVNAYAQVHFGVAIELELDPGWKRAPVREAVRETLSNRWPAAAPFGQRVRASDVRNLLTPLPGVANTIVKLFRRESPNQLVEVLIPRSAWLDPQDRAYPAERLLYDDAQWLP